jgi:hypothetical protein
MGLVSLSGVHATCTTIADVTAVTASYVLFAHGCPALEDPQDGPLAAYPLGAVDMRT